jgi:hypothetical protein
MDSIHWQRWARGIARTFWIGVQLASPAAMAGLVAAASSNGYRAEEYVEFVVAHGCNQGSSPLPLADQRPYGSAFRFEASQ